MSAGPDANGTFSWRSDLTISGLGAVTDIAIQDVNQDGEQDVIVSTPTQVRLLTNAIDVLTSSPIVNGGFEQGLGLTGWTREILGHSAAQIPGTVTGLSDAVQFIENDSFLTSLSQTFVVPANPQTLQVDLLSLGLEAPQGGLPDAFEISLLGANDQSFVPTHQLNATSFFSLNPGNLVSRGSTTTFDGRTVTLDLSGLTPGTPATLHFDLIGNAPGRTSTVTIDNVRISPESSYAEGFSVTPLAGPFVNATGLATGDVDGDGRMDIVVSDAGADRVVVFNGTASGVTRDARRDQRQQFRLATLCDRRRTAHDGRQRGRSRGRPARV